MRLIVRLERDGQVLFRSRSFVPFVLVPLWLIAVNDGSTWQEVIGEEAEDLATIATFIVSLLGLAIRWITVGFVPSGTSGRNTLEQRATALNTTGMYSIMRHPLYLGNFIALLGFALATKTWWFPLMFGLAFWLYIERVMAAEEVFLHRMFGPAFDDWAARTPAFLPRLALWRAPALTFSLRTVLRREYNGLLAVAAAFFVYELLTDVLIGHEALREWLAEDFIWPTALVLGTLIFIGLRTLKRHTTVLRVQDR